MEASPLLQKFYRRDFAEELCAEARKGAVEPLAREPAGPPQGRTPECAARRLPEPRASYEGIEFLELYQQWGMDTSTNEYSGMQRLQLHGIGHELAEDLPEERRKKGERIEWSVSLTPLRELLELPVRVKAEVRITEEDATAKAYMNEIRRARCADVTLGQVIHGLLWELSFHGGPQEQREVSEDLKRRVAEVDDGTVELVSVTTFSSPCTSPDATRSSMSSAVVRCVRSRRPSATSTTTRTRPRGWSGSSRVPSWSSRSFATVPVASSARPSGPPGADLFAMKKGVIAPSRSRHRTSFLRRDGRGTPPPGKRAPRIGVSVPFTLRQSDEAERLLLCADCA